MVTLYARSCSGMRYLEIASFRQPSSSINHPDSNMAVFSCLLTGRVRE